MSVAYVVEQHSSVAREGERLLIKKGGAVLHTLRLHGLDQLVLFGQVHITPAALSCLLDTGKDTVFMTAGGRYRGRLQPPTGKNIALRYEQFRKLSDEGFRLRTARSIVAGKIGNLRTTLMRLNRSREGLSLDNHILELKRLAQMACQAEDLDVLRGYEGRGAARYFNGFAGGFLAGGIEFKRRVRRPPTDPVNALLSFGYALLFNVVMSAVNLVGFDPYLGCLHVLEYGRPSLPLDLMEEWRPIVVDNLVLSLFNLKVLTRDDFVLAPKEDEDGMETTGAGDEPDENPTDGHGAQIAPGELPVRLTDAGLRKTIAQFERRLSEKVRHHLTERQMSYRECITEQVRHFARYVRGEEDLYRPMTLR